MRQIAGLTVEQFHGGSYFTITAAGHYRIDRNDAGFRGRQWEATFSPDGTQSFPFKGGEQFATLKDAVAEIAAHTASVKATQLRAAQLRNEREAAAAKAAMDAIHVGDTVVYEGGKGYVAERKSDGFMVQDFTDADDAENWSFYRAEELTVTRRAPKLPNGQTIGDAPADKVSGGLTEAAEKAAASPFGGNPELVAGTLTPGSKVEIVTFMGSVFGATVMDLSNENSIVVANPTTKLAESHRDRYSINGYRLSYRSIRTMREVKPGEEVDRAQRERAAGLALAAHTILTNPWATKEDVQIAERQLQEAANAAHWSYVKLGDALAATIKKNGA